MVLNPRTPFAIICSELLFRHFGFLATFCLSDFSISDNFLYLALSEMPCQLCINSNTFGDWFSSSSYSRIYLTNHFWCRYLYQFSDLWKWQPSLYSYPLNLFFQFPLWALSRVEREKNVLYNETHFIYGYMASDTWLRTILIVRKETRCRHIGYSYRLTARVLLYAPSHR